MHVLEKLGPAAGILFLVLAVWLIWRREKCRRRISRMHKSDKISSLNGLAAPFGFTYVREQDIFLSRIDAWQRREGYEALFDRLALKFHMVIDAFPVYFDYQGKTWLIEFWKGQYGINTGAEAGIYHANRIVPAELRRQIHYNAVSDEEMPLIGILLKQKNKPLFTQKGRHWWLAAFKMGAFCDPGDLILHASVTFSDPAQAQAFYRGFLEAGYPKNRCRIKKRRVTVLFDQSNQPAEAEKLYRRLVQKTNRLFCVLYRFVSMPFTGTPDRMLFLFERLPWCFRHMLRLHSFGRKARVKNGM